MHALAAALLLAASVRAVQFTWPSKDQKVELDSTAYIVKWTTVASDPTSATLLLVNNVAGHTPYSQNIAVVDLTQGSYTVEPIKGLAPETGYQFNLVSTAAQNSGILAQSDQFEVVPGSASAGGSSASPSPGSGSSTTMSSPTATGASPTSTPTGTDPDGDGDGDSGSGSGSGSANATITGSGSGGLSPTGTATTTSGPHGTASGSLPTKSSNSGGSKVMAGSALALAVGVVFALLA